MKRTLMLLLLSTAQLGADDSKVNQSLLGMQDTIARKPGLVISYTCSNFYSGQVKTAVNDVFKCQLKARGACFWLDEEGEVVGDPATNLHYQLAFDGKTYQIINKYGDLQIGSSPGFLHPEQLTMTPLALPYFFALPSKINGANVFESLRDPNLWIGIAAMTQWLEDSADGTRSLEIVNGERTYSVKVRPDLDYFPVSWRKYNREGLPVTFACSDFHRYSIDGVAFQFPSELSQTLSAKDRSVISATRIKIESIAPLVSEAGDKSIFEIPSMSAKSIFDNDVGVFIK